MTLPTNENSALRDNLKHQKWIDEKQKIDEVMNRLCELFPKTFDWKHPKPLKLGIIEDIMLLENHGYSRQSISKALSFYTSRLAYLTSLVKKKCRFDLEGREEGVILESHREHAKGLLKKRKDRYRKREVKKDTEENSTV